MRESSDPLDERKPEKPRMNLESIGVVMLVVGAAIAILGGVFWLASRLPGLNQLFNLPGDIRIQTENVSCFFPIVSMILISVVLTILLNIVLRLINRQ